MGDKITKIQSVRHLEEESEKTGVFFIVLNFGVRSTKRVTWDGKQFHILNEIDGSRQKLTPDQLYTQSNIGQAIDKGAFFKDNS